MLGGHVMNKKKTFGSKVEDFMAGKGFYIVLFACVAVIGVSAWALLFAGDFGVGTQQDYVSGNLGTTPDGDIDYGIDLNVGAFSDAEDAGLTTDGGEEVTEPVTVTDPAAVTQPEQTGTKNNADTQPQQPAGNSEKSDGAESGVDAEQPEEQNTITIGDLTFIWPLSGEIAVDFSMDSLIYDKTMADWRTHNGIDLAAQIGTKVMSIAAGTVKDVYTDDLLGTTVVVEHIDGLCSSYSNLAAVPAVSAGDTVAMGTVIGAVGDTAVGETGEVAHLHFSVNYKGLPIDPADYLPIR